MKSRKTKKRSKSKYIKSFIDYKIIRAEGDTQSVVFEGKTPVVVINSDVQEYDTKQVL